MMSPSANTLYASTAFLRRIVSARTTSRTCCMFAKVISATFFGIILASCNVLTNYLEKKSIKWIYRQKDTFKTHYKIFKKQNPNLQHFNVNCSTTGQGCVKQAEQKRTQTLECLLSFFFLCIPHVHMHS